MSGVEFGIPNDLEEANTRQLPPPPRPPLSPECRRERMISSRWCVCGKQESGCSRGAGGLQSGYPLRGGGKVFERAELRLWSCGLGSPIARGQHPPAFPTCAGNCQKPRLPAMCLQRPLPGKRNITLNVKTFLKEFCGLS